MAERIKIGFCVAYDWEFLKYSLPLVYESADSICLSIDKDCISWSGKRFQFDRLAFDDFIATIDVKKKISLLEQSFHLPNLSPMQNEVRQRNIMAEFMEPGGWHVQLDADEYFLEFDRFVEYLKHCKVDDATNVCCVLLTVFKKLEGGFLVIDPGTKENLETIAIATRKPAYQYGRRNGYFNHLTSFKILHQSWARSEGEILAKISNWGHRDDFDVDRFFMWWKSLDIENYKGHRYFHPINPSSWPGFILIKSNSMADLILNASKIRMPFFTRFELLLKNSKMISRLKHLLRLTLD